MSIYPLGGNLSLNPNLLSLHIFKIELLANLNIANVNIVVNMFVNILYNITSDIQTALLTDIVPIFYTTPPLILKTAIAKGFFELCLIS